MTTVGTELLAAWVCVILVAGSIVVRADLRRTEDQSRQEVA